MRRLYLQNIFSMRNLFIFSRKKIYCQPQIIASHRRNAKIASGQSDCDVCGR